MNNDGSTGIKSSTFLKANNVILEISPGQMPNVHLRNPGHQNSPRHCKRPHQSNHLPLN